MTNYLTPEVRKCGVPLRGNKKIDGKNDVWTEGLSTFEFPVAKIDKVFNKLNVDGNGCGRLEFSQLNPTVVNGKCGTCYDSCYANQKWRNLNPLYHGTAITTDIPDLTGKALRLGVATDGSAWMCNKNVLDAINQYDFKLLFSICSCYYPVPPVHELSKKNVQLQVSVSSWFEDSETQHRIKWAREAQKKGWTTAFRWVSYDLDNPNVAKRTDQNRELRMRKTINKLASEFDNRIVENPYHTGPLHSQLQLFTGCGVSGNIGTCANCANACGFGRMGFKKLSEVNG